MNFHLIRTKSILIIICILLFYVTLTLISDVTKVLNFYNNIKYEFVILALLLQFLALIIRTIRQKKLLDAIDVHLSTIENFKVYFSGVALISTPIGIGQAIKSQILKDKLGISRSKTLPIVLLERYYDILSIIIILIIITSISFNLQSALIIGISSILMAIFFALLYKNGFVRIKEILSRIKLIQRIIPSNELDDSLSYLIKSRNVFIGIGVSLVIWTIDALGVYFVFKSFSLDINILKAIQYYLTSLAYGTVSFLPGGVGITEGSMIGLLIQDNYDLHTASALVIFVRLSTIWFATILGFTLSHKYLKQK